MYMYVYVQVEVYVDASVVLEFCILRCNFRRDTCTCSCRYVLHTRHLSDRLLLQSRYNLVAGVDKRLILQARAETWNITILRP